MKISSEQEMLDFGKRFAEDICDGVTWTGDAPGGGPPLSISEVGEEKARQDPSSNVPAEPVQSTRQDPSKAIVIELIGDVGAGKTTFVRGLAEGLGIKEPVTSPSYTISKSYALPGGGNLIHYDFYRLDDPGLMSEDLAENLTNPHNIVVIEWGASIKNLLPARHITINIDYNNDNTRSITI